MDRVPALQRLHHDLQLVVLQVPAQHPGQRRLHIQRRDVPVQRLAQGREELLEPVRVLGLGSLFRPAWMTVA